MSNTETRFVEETLKGGRNEVAMAKMALTQSNDNEVKGFAQRLVNDHTGANSKLEALATVNHLPKELNSQSADPRTDARTNTAVVGQPIDTNLAGLKGSEFDKAFAKMMAMNHQSSITKYEAMEKEASNPALKAYPHGDLAYAAAASRHGTIAREVVNSVRPFPRGRILPRLYLLLPLWIRQGFSQPLAPIAEKGPPLPLYIMLSLAKAASAYHHEVTRS